MKYSRCLELAALIKKKSLFLFGARQTGKTTLLKATFPGAVFYDLLRADTFRELSARPELIRERRKPSENLIIIDEVQKLPTLLDEVHHMIESDKSLRFILTGSSARKLKRGNANLLAGRAWTCHLFPLVSKEAIQTENDFLKLLNRGGLPAILDSADFEEDIRAYVGTYLREEIQAEGLTRSIERFSRFLEASGFCNGEQVNFTAVGNDTGIPPRTVREYFQILEDTLLGHLLPAFRETEKRKPTAMAKFYFFDMGVTNHLLGRAKLRPKSETFGRALEHLVFLEVKAWLGYHRSQKKLTYWRSTSGFEVDFLIGREVAIEVKATENVTKRECKGLLVLNEEISFKRRIIVSNEKHYRRFSIENHPDIEVFPMKDFLNQLWAGEILKP